MNLVVLALAAVSLTNLLLTVGVIRRLREHTELLGAGPAPVVMREAGELVGDYRTVAVDGRPVTRDQLAGLTLVGFFSPTCGPCHERLPEFVGRARRTPDGRALAVVVGEEADMVEALSPVATVVVEPPGGDLVRAFGVRGFPAVCYVDGDGRVVASGTVLPPAPLPVAA